jgi:hypothetical protein
MAAPDLRAKPFLRFFLRRGGRPHMPMRHARTTTLAALGPPAQPRHFGGNSAFVEEDQAFRVEIDLAFKPGLARRRDVLALLLAGVRGFF